MSKRMKESLEGYGDGREWWFERDKEGGLWLCVLTRDGDKVDCEGFAIWTTKYYDLGSETIRLLEAVRGGQGSFRSASSRRRDYI